MTSPVLVQPSQFLDLRILKEFLLEAAFEAGSVIEEIFPRDDRGQVRKNDGSWVTNADKASNEILSRLLPHVYKALVVSEECIPPLSQRSSTRAVWIIDPLDNTKAFVERELDKCAINIALAIDGVPVLGYVHYFCPARGNLGISGDGAFDVEYDASGKATLTQMKPLEAAQEEPIFIGYRKKLEEMTQLTRDYLTKAGATNKTIVEKKLLPFRLQAVINGDVDAYLEPRPIHEWDIAAAVAVALARGGEIRALETGRPIMFNSAELNAPPFLLTRGGVITGEIFSKLLS